MAPRLVWLAAIALSGPLAQRYTVAQKHARPHVGAGWEMSNEEFSVAAALQPLATGCDVGAGCDGGKKPEPGMGTEPEPEPEPGDGFSGATNNGGGSVYRLLQAPPEPEPEMEPGGSPAAGTCPAETLGLEWLGKFSKNSWAASPAEQCYSTCVSNAGFGPTGTDSVDAMVGVPVVVTQPQDGCSALTNAAAVAGKIALVRRGNCHYSAKVYVAQQAGAAAAIVYNSNAGSTAAMRGGDNAEL